MILTKSSKKFWKVKPKLKRSDLVNVFLAIQTSCKSSGYTNLTL